MTECRRNEALALQWSWIDFERRIAKLRDSKTGQKVVHLGDSVLSLIKSLPKVAGSPLVFPSSVEEIDRSVSKRHGMIFGIILQVWPCRRDKAYIWLGNC